MNELEMPEEVRQLLEEADASKTLIAIRAQSRLVEMGLEVTVEWRGLKSILLIDRDVMTEKGGAERVNLFVSMLNTLFMQSMAKTFDVVEEELNHDEPSDT